MSRKLWSIVTAIVGIGIALFFFFFSIRFRGQQVLKSSTTVLFLLGAVLNNGFALNEMRG